MNEDKQTKESTKNLGLSDESIDIIKHISSNSKKDIREQMNRIKRSLNEIQAAIDVLNTRHGIKFAIVENLRSEKSINLDKGIDKLAAALNRTAKIKDQSVPPITRKEFTWSDIEIKQFPKIIGEEYE